MTFTPVAPAGPCPNCGVAAQLITNGSLTYSNCGYMTLSGDARARLPTSDIPDARIDTTNVDFGTGARDTGRAQSATETFFQGDRS